MATIERMMALAICSLWACPAIADTTSAESAEDEAAATPPTQESGWQFSASPYFWMSGIKGDMGVVEEIEPVAIDLSFNNGFVFDAARDGPILGATYRF